MGHKDELEEPDDLTPRILTYEDFESLVESFADEVVNLVCQQRNPNLDGVFRATCPREKFRPILAPKVTPEATLAREIIPLSDSLHSLGSRPPRPPLEIVLDQFRGWIYTSAAKKVAEKAASAASRINSKIWGYSRQIAKKIIADSDLASYNPTNINYDRYIPPNFEEESQDDLFLIQNFNKGNIHFRLKLSPLKELLKDEILKALPLAISDRIKEEVSTCISKSLIDDYNGDQQNLAALAPATLDSQTAGKSPSVRAIISSLKDKIIKDLLSGPTLKPTFLKIIDLLIAEGYDNEKIAALLIAKFGEYTIGNLLNNFSLWIVGCIKKKGHKPIYFDREKDHLDELIIDNDDYQTILGRAPSDTTWRQFFADVDSEFALLKTSDEQWIQANLSTINCYLLPAFIGLAKKGYNVGELSG